MIMTHCRNQNGINEYQQINIYHHQQREIAVKTIVGGTAMIYLVKKMIGLKIIQYIGWKKIYRSNHRRSRSMMSDQPLDKQEKSKKMLGYYSKIARKTYDFFQRHPKLIENWLLFDRIISNTVLYIPRKGKLGLHRWIRRQMELQKIKNKSNPLLKYPKKWYGPLMLNYYSMVGYTNIIILSEYVLIKFYQNHLLFDAAFIMNNHSNLVELNEKIQQNWRENPHEKERKEYINLLKLK